MAINSLLVTELSELLDDEKYDRVGFHSGNSRNGSYSRTLHTEYGDLAIQIPRDRNGEFKQQTVAPYKRSNDTLEDTVSKEAVYIAVGIREDGSKKVLAYTIAPTESAYNWQELLEKLKDRGVENVLLFVSDGLKGMADTVFNMFPKAKYPVV